MVPLILEAVQFLAKLIKLVRSEKNDLSNIITVSSSTGDSAQGTTFTHRVLAVPEEQSDWAGFPYNEKRIVPMTARAYRSTAVPELP